MSDWQRLRDFRGIDRVIDVDWHAYIRMLSVQIPSPDGSNDVNGSYRLNSLWLTSTMAKQLIGIFHILLGE